MHRAALAGIVVAVFAVATLVGVAPYTLNSTRSNASGQSFGAQMSTQIASTSDSSPTVYIVKGAGQNGGVAEPFAPSIINIRAGDKVTWINQDTGVHTVTSPLFDSGAIASGNGSKSSFSHTFDQKGIFPYYCKIHPYMGGTVYVDTVETQRDLLSTTNPSLLDVKVELPQNAAYQNKYGPYFIPENAIVPVGAKVTWTNHDFIAHTATSGDNGSSFDTGPIPPGASKTLTLTKLGVHSYFCEIHPWMIGALTVINNSTRT